MAGNIRREFATGAALRDGITRDRLRASTAAKPVPGMVEALDELAKVVAQIAPTAVMPMRRKWKRSTISNANAVAESMDPARNARLIEDMAAGMGHHVAATTHGISIRAARAIFGSHLLGRAAVACDHKTLWASKNFAADMNHAKNEAGRAAELAALSAEARQRRAEAPLGSLDNKRSNREVRHAARRAAFDVWAQRNGDVAEAAPPDGSKV